MSAPELDGSEAEGVRFMLHVFYRECGSSGARGCHHVMGGGQVQWTHGGLAVNDYRDADGASSNGHQLCAEGFRLARAARARDWGV